MSITFAHCPAALPHPRPFGTVRALAAGAVATAAAALATAAATSLGPVFVVVALTVYAGVAVVILARIVALHPAAQFGLPNLVTLGRAAATALVAGFAAEAALGPATAAPLAAAFAGVSAIALAAEAALGPATAAPLAAAFAGVSAIALAADGVDGWLARRVGPATRFGARFDMEIDALLILALSLLVFALGKAGAFVLLIGLMRYLFVAAAALWPWLAGDLPPSWRRKAVCVIQGVALVLVALPAVGPGAGSLLAAAALAALVESFGADVVTLARRRGR